MTSCASVANGNPLFWDEKTANDLTDGFIAPPSMISAWFRPHQWAPNREEVALPLQVHFDLKEKLELPEAGMTDNTIVFGVPGRIGILYLALPHHRNRVTKYGAEGEEAARQHLLGQSLGFHTYVARGPVREQHPKQ